jgi:DNA primase
MALPANFLDELRSRSPIAAVIGRSVKLTRSGRERKGCCPFHGEKTPSFYVYDDHYHCFGCGAHGDVISFVMQSTGAGFMEAVEDLAAQAGLEVPKPTPQAAEAEARRAGIAEVLEAAVSQYRAWLFEPQGKAALEYLRGRGLSDATIRRFGLGWSGEGRGQLAGALRGKNIKPDQLIEAGLMKEGDHGPVDMFFARVMFPIRDRRGAMLSFGGRIMGDGQPKYVNGPETAVFSKRRSLYNLDQARAAVRKGEKLIVVEGYMDVIALAQAGFGGAVAPLGTALTDEHLEEIWRLTPSPVFCFDGDAAGQRAALKTTELALAQLVPDKTLKLLTLTGGDDPDSLIRKGGPKAFQEVLDKAQPVSAALYPMLAAVTPRGTPEQNAAFLHRLDEVAGLIKDKTLAGEYKQHLRGLYYEERRLARAPGPQSRAPVRAPGRTGRWAPPPGTVPEAQLPVLRQAMREMPSSDLLRARHMLATFFWHPELIHDLDEAFAHITLPPAEARLREALHEFDMHGKTLDRAKLLAHLDALGLGEQVRDLETSLEREEGRVFDPLESPAEAVRNWWNWYNHMSDIIRILRAQHDEALRDYAARMDDEEAQERLKRYTHLLREAEAGEAGGTDG